MSGIHFSVGLMGYGDYNNSISFGQSLGYSSSVGSVGATSGADQTGDVTRAGRRSSPEECQTCKERKYQDGSDENVSFKAAAHISPENAASAVRGHEQEHVSNAYTSAAQKGGRVINASVSIHTSVCPECGRTYVSGGTTDTLIKYPKSEDQVKQGQNSDRNAQENFDI
jgi:hypothetical protein